MSDAAWFKHLVGKQECARAGQLAEARRVAEQRGKEPFDLELFEALHDTTTDLGTLPPREERLQRWEHKYYVQHADVMSLAELAQRMQAMAPYL